MQGIEAAGLLVVAPVMGSFLALLADRLPRDEDVIATRSRCRSCGTQIRARDLVPLLSWALRRGRCRDCGAAIPPVVWAMEWGALGLAALVVFAGLPAPEGVATAGVLWLLMALVVCDLAWFRLPNALNAALLGLALTLALLEGTLPEALLGAVLGSGSFLALRTGYFLLRRCEGLGLGDVKMMAGLGAFLGPLALPNLVLLASVLCLLGALSGGGLAARRRLPLGAGLGVAAMLLWGLRVFAGFG